MMEKVKVSREQAEAIEDWADKEQLIVAKATGLLEHGRDEPIDELTMKELVVALYIGYEVEPEFKKGDYVMVKWKNREKEEFYRVVSIDPWGSIQIETLDGVPNVSGHENTRHATPSEIAEEKERRFWKKHGRDVWELKTGDVLWDPMMMQAMVVDHIVNKREVQFSDGDWDDLKEMRGNYTVIVFAENRLDREGQ